jgi:hypothetical protein
VSLGSAWSSALLRLMPATMSFFVVTAVAHEGSTHVHEGSIEGLYLPLTLGDETRLSGHVRRQERSSEPCVEESHVTEVRVARRITPYVVRHPRFGRQAGDAATEDVPRRCEGGGWMVERPSVLTFEVAVTSIVESNPVNIDYAAALVA